jgi:hypothetical protein
MGESRNVHVIKYKDKCERIVRNYEREVEINYIFRIPEFSATPPDTFRHSIWIRPRPLPFKSFPIYQSPYHATLNILLAESIVKQPTT